MTNGIIYIAYGQQYIKEAQRSAQSVKTTCNLPTCLISNINASGFDNFIQFEKKYDKYPLLNKPYALSSVELPYDRFLFLDSDTVVLDDISKLFELLDYCWIAVSYCKDNQSAIFGLPMFNTGVILSSKEEEAFFSNWYRLAVTYIDKYKHNDQGSFYDEIINWYSYIVLPAEFNVRVSQQVPLSGKAYILHGRGARLDAAIEKINKTTQPRIWNGKSHSYSLAE